MVERPLGISILSILLFVSDIPAIFFLSPIIGFVNLVMGYGL